MSLNTVINLPLMTAMVLQQHMGPGGMGPHHAPSWKISGVGRVLITHPLLLPQQQFCLTNPERGAVKLSLCPFP